jgi:hypothetical protein
MNSLRLVRARLRGFLRKEQLEQEIEEELRFHVAMRTEENIARGMAPAAAAEQARRQLGTSTVLKTRGEMSPGAARSRRSRRTFATARACC